MANISRATQLRVFYRDSWHCVYCQHPVFFNHTFKLLDQMAPGHGYYHPNGKTGELLDLIQWRFASADHVMPVSLGGNEDIDNLATACWKCNLAKSKSHPDDFVKPTLPTPEVVALRWDGLASVYTLLPGADPAWCRLIREHEPSRTALPFRAPNAGPEPPTPR